MAYWLTAYQADGGELLAFEIELTREQFEHLMGDRLAGYDGAGEYPVELDFFVGEAE